ncbi:MAG: hypothetical protein B7X41_06765 [Microbacterium sp. 14-71-5]|nr:MAG: hypothetical protein B7X41_06765 [Microbacterium sp. 14-71-5]
MLGQAIAGGAVDALTSAVEAVVEGVQRPSPVGGEPLEVLLSLVEQLDRLSAAAAWLSVSAAEDGMWAADGYRSFAHWLAARTGMSFVRARELVTTGRVLRDHLPATSAAALAGAVGRDQVRTMVTVVATSEPRCEALAGSVEECGEEFLVEHAAQDGADGFRRLARRWAAAADPDADECGYREACDREFVGLAATKDGYHLSGFLTTEHGAAVNAALDTVMTPPAPDDRRTTQQRRAQGLADVARLVLDHGLVGTGVAVRPHLDVVVDFETLRRAVEAGASDLRAVGGAVERRVAERRVVERGAGRRARRPFRLPAVADVERFAVAELVGAGPVPQTVLARLACDSAVSRLVFGPDLQVINVGRAERTYAGPRRRAVVARDGTCRYPGCTAPPALGEIHHVAEWVRDAGETDVNTGVLLCWHHHDVVHRHHVRIRPSRTGGWSFSSRHGVPLVALRGRSGAPAPGPGRVPATTSGRPAKSRPWLL